MNVPNFAGTKRKASEMQQAAVRSAPMASAPIACAAPVVSVAKTAGEGAEGGGGEGTGDLDEEEEPSSSSSPSSSLGNPTLGTTRAKRFKRTSSSDCEQAPDSAGSDLTECESRSPLAQGGEEPSKVKEYGRLTRVQLQEAQVAAEGRGGACLSRVTIKAGNVLAFQCRFGHIFQSTVEAARTAWCPFCTKYYIQCVEWARTHGGRLLDKELSAPVHFECSKGHSFSCVSYTAYFSKLFLGSV